MVEPTKQIDTNPLQVQSSSELMARALAVTPGGVHSPVRAFKSVGGTPVFFKHAQGAFLTSVEGKRYIDFCMSFGPLILGHRDPEVQEAVLRIVDTAWSFGACEPFSLCLAEWITARLPFVEKLRFVSSGTEAVMSALRVARAVTGRDKILKFAGMYHGHADAMLVKAGSGLAGEASSDSAGVTQEMAAHTLIAPLDDEESLQRILREHGHEIGAVILEPLPANYGLLVQRPEFLQAVVDGVRKVGGLVIFDEVISGFRVAMGGMAEVLGIEPDLVTYGKVIGGGFPVGGFGGRKQWMDYVAPVGPVYQAGTLSANPVGMVAGLATLQKVEREQVHQKLATKTAQFATTFNERVRRYPLTISHYGSLIWLHPHSDKPIRRLEDIPPGQAETFKKIFHGTLRRGVYLAPSGFEVGFLSMAHSDAVLEQSLDALVAACEEVYGSKA